MKVLAINTDCTDNGSGIRTVIYIAGCNHRCIQCHNPSSWNINNGKEYSLHHLVEKVMENPLAQVTLTGGDPLTFQYEETVKLAKLIKEKTDKNIWLYTGYTMEQILKEKLEICRYIDVIVDGRFEIVKKDLNLQFRGSINQRIIDVNRTLEKNSIQLWREGLYV